MARVSLMGPLRTAAGISDPIDVEVGTVKALLAELERRYPALGPLLAEGVAVAIDGEIYQDILLQPIGRDADVQVLPPLAGG
jgi:molybdopterin converting factor small subunit